MVRTPCCKRLGIKKGPWSPEEDRILVNYINLYGHGNWRALPRKAGLLRCGKSCRLRWTNYLRPDIKRGNYSREEEEKIIKLHEELGNRWSLIAAELPGRTDNEIKNVWHTYLKKRLDKQNQSSLETNKEATSSSNSDCNQDDKKERAVTSLPNQSRPESLDCVTSSSQQSTSEITSMSSVTNNNIANNNDSQNDNNNNNNNNTSMCNKTEALGNFVDMNEDFWSEVLSADTSSIVSSGLQGGFNSDIQVSLPLDTSSVTSDELLGELNGDIQGPLPLDTSCAMSDEFQGGLNGDIQTQLPLETSSVMSDEFQGGFNGDIQLQLPLSPLPHTSSIVYSGFQGGLNSDIQVPFPLDTSSAMSNEFQGGDIRGPLPLDTSCVMSDEFQGGLNGDIQTQLPLETLTVMSDEFQGGFNGDIQLQLPLSPLSHFVQDTTSSIMSDNLAFWFDIFTREGDLTQQPDFE